MQATTITFASTNQNKFHEVESILAAKGIRAGFARLELVEIQSDSLEEIAKEKARSAYAKVKKPVIVEDDGLYVDALAGFPGQYSSYVFKTIGNAGILKLLEGKKDRSASFRSLVAFFDGGNDIHLFEGKVQGRISEKIAQGGWGYDPIFVPEGAGATTFAELASSKNDYSHRKMALDKFAAWWLAKDTT
ncbi:XTP/dITP diphosphatase [Nitrososphaera viennensis]|uniref:XTP/dITP diphosphatase n=1 Tax=Nitrososphaera viennensis TaxID=1034015 RepID=A0A977IGR0_9ARCH|nr:XTP/dITP diphosphatase [Nitrososphaera viennensis]UVS70470.1 XTP/dITP diphosphatase [Nitrososphaera viennensis]